MSDFYKALQYTFRLEGGYSNSPYDRGGKTKYGITEERAKQFGFRVENLTREQASAIYKAMYWRVDGISSQLVANKIFAICVVAGPAKGIQIAQGAVNLLHDSYVLGIDGLIGPKTEKEIENIVNSGRELQLIYKIIELEVKHYAEIVTNNAKARIEAKRKGRLEPPNQAMNCLGWINRAYNLPIGAEL